MKHRNALVTALTVAFGLAMMPVQATAHSDAPSHRPSPPFAASLSGQTQSSLLSAQSAVDALSLPSTATYMETTANSLNFRSGPSTSYSIIGSLPRGTLVEVLSKVSTSWYRVRANGRTGYVGSKYLKATTSTPATVSSTGTVYVTTGSVNFRTGPSTSYSVIRKLTSGTKVELISKYSSTWYKVSVNGTTGYLSSKYLSQSVSTSAPATSGTYVTTGSVNFRTGPSTSYSVIRKLSSGTKVELISKYSSTWYKVSVSGTVGYLSAKYLAPDSGTAPATTIPVHSIGYSGGLHKKIADLRPYLDPAWNGHNYMDGSELQIYLDKGWLVTWGVPLNNYDNKTTMILGHGSGVFNYMINIKVGSLVSVSDLNGKVRTYQITDVKSNPTSSFYLKYNNGVSLADIFVNGGIEEAISLQMCQDSVNTHYYGVPVK